MRECPLSRHLGMEAPASPVPPTERIMAGIDDINRYPGKSMPLAVSEGQLEQIKTFAYQLPRHLCSQYLHHSPSCCRATLGADVWGPRTRQCMK
jgi:hypothetical protein